MPGLKKSIIIAKSNLETQLYHLEQKKLILAVLEDNGLEEFMPEMEKRYDAYMKAQQEYAEYAVQMVKMLEERESE